MAAAEALTLLREDLENDDPEIRVEAMARVSAIAALLGPAKFEADLLPLLSHSFAADGQHDQVLQVLAEQLGRCIPLLPGARLVCLVEPLAALSKVEETVVRDKAVESLQVVLRGLDARAALETAVPTIQALVATEWFTARVSAASLFAAAYGQLGAGAGAAGAGAAPPEAACAEARGTLRKLFATLCEDETPMVRRAAARQLGALAGALERERLAGELLPLFLALAQDEQETVRLLALECTRALSAVLAPSERAASLLPLIKASAGDKSWKVRGIMARELGALAEELGAGAAGEHLLPLLRRLVRDPEGEVRAASARASAAFVALVGLERLAGDVLPAVTEGVSDPLQSVRVASIETLMALSPHLSQEQAHRLVMPSMLVALKDDVPEVRLAVLASLAKAAPALGAEKVDSTLVPIFTELAQDRMWRVRDSVIAQMPLLTTSIGVAVFQEKLLQVYLGCFQDQVYAVRARAIASIGALLGATSEAWALAHILPKLVELYQERDNTYLQRITALQGMREVALACSSEEAMAVVLPVLERAAGDDVPNVRAVCAHFLGDVAAAAAARDLLSSAQLQGIVVPTLGRLAQDAADQEVRFAAGHSLKRCPQL